jgi:4-amino-4-deoxy-L-arabinose transferase-like glycosyltransferase
MIRRLRSHPLTVILILAIVVRLAVLLIFPKIFDFVESGVVQGSDAYDAYAQNLLATGVYGRTPGVPDASIPPLYSYALAVVYGLIGRGYVQVGLFHILLDSASILLVYHIGKRLFPKGEAVGLLAGLGYALYPYLIFQNLTVLDNPLFITELYAFILLMILLRERPALDRGAWILAALGGLTLGLGMLTRPILPPLAILVAPWFLFRLNLKQTILRLLPVALVGGAALLPWIVRNQQIFHAFVPMTTTSGANFWQGNSRYTVPVFRAGYDVQWTTPTPDMKTVDLYSREADAERFALGFQYLRDHPDKIPELLWTKFLIYWSIDVAPRLNPKPGERLELDDAGNLIILRVDENGQLLTYGANDPIIQYSTPLFDQLGRVIHLVYWGGLFLLGLVGIVLSLRYWRDVSLLWFVQISMMLVYVFFHPSTRYRAPTDPLWFLFSAYAILWFWQWWRTRREKRTLQLSVTGT